MSAEWEGKTRGTNTDTSGNLVGEKQWEEVQKKTFTKWCNSHLKKVGSSLADIQNDWTDDLPKYNANPKMRPQKLDNLSLAFDMIEKAKIKTNFLKTHHLADCELKMILGMVWAIILDFQIKGISVEEKSAKEGLLLWCQKKTKGYRDVGIDNFHTSWQDGMALCALIHRHRPDLIDFDNLDRKNKRENLQYAFDVAQNSLGIEPLLDVSDMVDTERPDERSVMTYISEFFHKFSSQDQKEVAARRIQKFVKFQENVEDNQNTYVLNTQDMLSWINNKVVQLQDRTFDDDYENAKQLIEAHKEYKVTEKTSQNEKKLDNENLYNTIAAKLKVNKRKNWTAPAGLFKEDVDQAWETLGQAETERGKALRDNLMRLKDLLRKDFAELANDFQRWVLVIKSELVSSPTGEFTEQLEELLKKEEEINNDQRLANLEAAHKRLEDAGIDDNQHTDLTFEELSLLWDQMKNVLKKRKAFLEDQLGASNNSNITADQLKEFRETFKHFDKDNSNQLDKLEFKACLQSLGQNLTDAEFNKLFEALSEGTGKVSFDAFVQYMISVTQDTDTADQIKQSFKQLANDNANISGLNLTVHPLEASDIQYLTTRMNGGKDSYDYTNYTDSVFE